MRIHKTEFLVDKYNLKKQVKIKRVLGIKREEEREEGRKENLGCTLGSLDFGMRKGFSSINITTQHQ